MNFENQNLSFSQKMKRFSINILDKICEKITGNGSSETPYNLIFLDIPAGFSERKLSVTRWNSPKLTWIPIIEIMAIGAGIIVALILTNL